MKNLILIAAFMFVLALARPAAAACTSNHWIKTVASNGSVVTLEDGSIWRVDPTDALFTSMTWTALAKIVACDDKLTHVDVQKSVNARRVQR